MKNARVMYTYSVGLLVVVMIMMLPGCGLLDWVKDKLCGPMPMCQEGDTGPKIQTDGSIAVALMDGKPLITQKSLETEKNELLESNPQLKAMIMYMDNNQLNRNLAEGLMNQAVIDRFVKDNKIDVRSDYQQELKRMMRSVKQMLNTKYFSQEFPVTITSAEVKDFYEKNKDVMPQLIVSRGGVKAVGVSFDKEQDAKDFMAKVKAAKGDIQKVAKEAGLSKKVTDFGVVNNQSVNLDSVLRDKIVDMKAPATELVKVNDKTFWVTHTSNKEETKYRPLDQIENDLKQYLEKERRVERVEKEIARLKNEYKITMNEEFFKSENNQGGQGAEQTLEVPAFGETEAQTQPVESTAKAA